MQDLKYFVDVVKRVHSGETSLFGLRKRKYSRNQLTTTSLFTSQSEVYRKLKIMQFNKSMFTLGVHLVNRVIHI